MERVTADELVLVEGGFAPLVFIAAVYLLSVAATLKAESF